MTLQELLPLYAPLAGLVGMAFWVGVLSERVKTNRLAIEKLENDSTVAEAPAVIRLEEKVGTLTVAVEKLTRGMEGVQRQLGNLMQTPGKIVELRHD